MQGLKSILKKTVPQRLNLTGKTLLGTQTRRFMNLHEYQAAQLLAEYKVPILLGKPAFTVEEAVQAANDIEANQADKNGLVIKAQIHAGGRGRGSFKESGLQGGVHLVDSAQDVWFFGIF